MCELELRGEEAWAFLVNSLAAANARVAELIEENVYYKNNSLVKGLIDDLQKAEKRAESAEAQNKRMRELLVEIQSYSETYLDLDSRMKHIIDCAKAALEDKP